MQAWRNGKRTALTQFECIDWKHLCRRWLIRRNSAILGRQRRAKFFGQTHSKRLLKFPNILENNIGGKKDGFTKIYKRMVRRIM